MSAKPSRNYLLSFWVSPEEQQKIKKRAKQYGSRNLSSYLRKMAMTGYVLHLDIPELREILSLFRYAGNNLNQLTRRANESGHIYENELRDLREDQRKIEEQLGGILARLSGFD